LFAVRPQVGKKYPPAGAPHDGALNSEQQMPSETGGRPNSRPPIFL
jgi:hypothetical protein